MTVKFKNKIKKILNLFICIISYHLLFLLQLIYNLYCYTYFMIFLLSLNQVLKKYSVIRLELLLSLNSLSLILELFRINFDD